MTVAHEDCGAKTRQKTPCKKPAGWGTNHAGEGKCKLHGGSNPVKHGRYSKINRPRLRDLVEQFENDPEPLNTHGELALVRALGTDYIQRYDEFTEALIAWHDSWKIDPDAPGKPPRVLDVADAYKIVSEVTRIVERIEKQRAENAVSRKDLLRVMDSMGRVVKAHADEKTYRKIERDWLLTQI